MYFGVLGLGTVHNVDGISRVVVQAQGSGVQGLGFGVSGSGRFSV